MRPRSSLRLFLYLPRGFRGVAVLALWERSWHGHIGSGDGYSVVKVQVPSLVKPFEGVHFRVGLRFFWLGEITASLVKPFQRAFMGGGREIISWYVHHLLNK